MENKAQLRIVLKRLMEENRYDLEEYGKWKERAEKAGETAAAESLEKARQCIAEGNKALGKALEGIT
ncbi:MAG TPA: hypothetical protein VGJ94_12430 [Syntrophorhabdaceae bacterium]|jgi:hypothetical protein